ncbi:MAG: ATP synthase subunit I [Acidobacteriota bacterium]
MSENIEPTAKATEIIRPPSHERILWIMALLGIAGGIAGFAFITFGFGLGIIVGTILAFVNYYWLKSSLRKIFSAAEIGEKPKMLAGKYFVRYIILGIVIAVIYITGMLPIVPVVLGLAAFGFAVVVEGFIRIFSAVFREKEI